MSKLVEKLTAYGADVSGIMERFFSDEEFYLECIEQFKADDNIMNLKSAIESKNYKEAFEIAHTLKGVIANLGLTPLFNAISDITEALRNNQYDNLDSLFNKVSDEIEKVNKEF